jgi:hypothetical protein
MSSKKNSKSLMAGQEKGMGVTGITGGIGNLESE